MADLTESKNTPANDILFRDFCYILDLLSKKKTPIQDKEAVLIQYMIEFKLNAAKGKEQKDTNFYPVLRLLVPSLDRERGAYNMKETKLAALLVKAIPLDKKSSEAQKLLNRTMNNVDADFGTIAHFILKNRIPHKTSSLTVGDVNYILDKIATADVGNKGPILDNLFSQVLRSMPAENIKWFLRIILKDLKLGLSAKRILSCFHPDAPDLYDTCQNLVKVCSEFGEGNTRPLEMGIEIFFAVSPMLSERLDIADISRYHSTSYQVEEKFDGERFQIHMQKQASDEESEEKHVFEYFSRRGYSYSSIYGKTYDSGLLTPKLKHCFSSHVTSFILDGEMMGWDKTRQIFGSKGMAFDVKKLTPQSKFQPCFCAFDILYFNGSSLVGPGENGGMKLIDRLKLLDAMFIDVKGVIQHSKRDIVTCTGDILNALNNAIDNQEEGIVIKDICSYYIANKRNAGWYKIKPEYTEGAMDDLDLVVIGITAGDRAKHGVAKSFLLAVADKPLGAAGGRWVCVGRVATGLTLDEREAVCAALRRHWRDARAAPPPPALFFNKVKPDYWLLPEHSVVLQVRASELIRSSQFGTPYTLRFARIKRVRDDKGCNDAMTLDEFNKLIDYPRAVVKLSTKRIGEDQIGDLDAKIRKKRIVFHPEVPNELKRITVGDVEVVSKALQGRKILILSDDEDCSKEDLIRIVESHGGKVVANLGFDTWCTVVGRATARVRNLVQKEAADVAPTAWLRALPPAPAPCSLAPLDLLAMSAATRAQCAREYDAFGDSYLKRATEHSLKLCFEKIEHDEPEVYLTIQETLELEQELFGDSSPFSFLRPFVLHFLHDEERSLLAIRANMYGATIWDAKEPTGLQGNLTHVVVPGSWTLQEGKDVQSKMVGVNPLFVVDTWLEKCFDLGKLIPDTPYLL